MKIYENSRRKMKINDIDGDRQRHMRLIRHMRILEIWDIWKIGDISKRQEEADVKRGNTEKDETYETVRDRQRQTETRQRQTETVDNSILLIKLLYAMS